MENAKKQKIEIGSSSQSQQTLTPREKFYQDTINMANNQQEPIGWSMKINGQLIYLNGMNYLNHCFQKIEVLLQESKNIRTKIPISKTAEHRYHIYDLEEILEYNFSRKYKLSINANISALKEIIQCIENDYTRSSRQNPLLIPD